MDPRFPRVSKTQYAFFTTSVKRAALRVDDVIARRRGLTDPRSLRITRSGPQITPACANSKLCAVTDVNCKYAKR